MEVKAVAVTDTSRQAIARMTLRQMIVCCVLGVVLWFVAAMLLKVLGPMGIYEGSARILLYALIIPGTVPFVFLIRWMAGLSGAQTGLGAALTTASALLLDGIAVAWFPVLYGSAESLVLGASAAILWGGGVAIFLGFLFSR